MFQLNNLQKTVQKKRKRLGRGEGSNRGKNAGKGHKGQNKHGQGVRIGFEGGQKSAIKRLPKFRGFKQPDDKFLAVLPLLAIEKAFDAGDKVTLESLKSKLLIGNRIKKVRIIKTGELKKVITFEEDAGIHLTKGVKESMNAK